METAPFDDSANDLTCHPLVHDVNSEHLAKLSRTERICKSIADATGSPWSLGLAVLVQVIWIPVGIITKLDPYPFAFLLTCSNILQLVLIFVLAVGQRQSSAHAELRAEHDHDAISRLLYHQELQEQVLIALARKTGIEVAEMEVAIRRLATESVAT